MNSRKKNSELLAAFDSHSSDLALDKVGTVSSVSVKTHTGKDWKTWAKILKSENAANMTYQELTSHLRTKHKLTPWWQHGVAVGFEVITGKRLAGQDAKGNYMVTATKSLSTSAEILWKHLISEIGLNVWLDPLSPVKLSVGCSFETRDGFFGEVRTILRNRRIRLKWQDPRWFTHTTVEVHVIKKAKNKCLLVFNHTGLKNLSLKTSFGTRWRAAAQKIAQDLCPEE